jgi:hypothetical protein
MRACAFVFALVVALVLLPACAETADQAASGSSGEQADSGEMLSNECEQSFADAAAVSEVRGHERGSRSRNRGLQHCG